MANTVYSFNFILSAFSCGLMLEKSHIHSKILLITVPKHNQKQFMLVVCLTLLWLLLLCSFFFPLSHVRFTFSCLFVFKCNWAGSHWSQWGNDYHEFLPCNQECQVLIKCSSVFVTQFMAFPISNQGRHSCYYPTRISDLFSVGELLYK